LNQDGDTTSLDGRKPRDKASPGAGSNGSGGSGSGSSSSNLPVVTNSKGGGLINGESPKSLRRRMSSTSEEGNTVKVNGTSELGSLDALKAEIMREVRAEIGRLRADLLEEFARMKQEMIDGLYKSCLV
jgi:hypothetical protein